MTVHLICEGPSCNPNVAAYDKEVALALKKSAGRGYIGGSLSRFGHELFRTLTHTAHEPRGQNYYGCITCGKERRWGNS